MSACERYRIPKARAHTPNKNTDRFLRAPPFLCATAFPSSGFPSRPRFLPAEAVAGAEVEGPS